MGELEGGRGRGGGECGGVGGGIRKGISGSHLARNARQSSGCKFMA